MTQHIAVESLHAAPSRRARLSRRQVMIGAAGLTFAVALGANRRAAAAALSGERSRQCAEPVGEHRRRRDDHDHVAGDRDGAGVHDLAAADHRGGTRRRLVEGAGRAGAADRRDLRQSRLRRHDVHRRLQRSDELLSAAAPVRRAGAPGVARQCRQEARRAASRSSPPSRARSCTPRRAASSAMARSPPSPKSPARPRRSSPRQLKKPSRVPAHRQGRAAGRAAG